MNYKINSNQKNLVNEFMDAFVKECDKQIKSLRDIKTFIYLIKEFGDYYYDVGVKKRNKLTHQVIKHSFRVAENLQMIICHLSDKGYYFNDDELYGMYISTILHDIGKIITENDDIPKDDHSIVSYLMVKYLIDKYPKINIKFNKNDVLEMIYSHSKKTKHRKKISIYSKIVRDADLFDECCGDSLYDLLRDVTLCENNNLNSYDYTEPDEIIKNLKTNRYKEYVIERINVEDNIKLFKKELKRAEKRYIEYFHKPDLNVTFDDIRAAMRLKVDIEI